MASSFQFRGLNCYAAATEDGAWTYVPSTADVQRSGAREPLLAFADLGTSGYMLFTARWSAPADDVAALREQLAARDPHAQLARATLHDPACLALVADGSGGFVAVASSATSAVPPYDAVFNLELRGADLEHARAALRGERGHLAIEYRAMRRAGTRATFTASGTALGDFWRAHEGEGSAAEVLERAIDQRIARIELDTPHAAGALAPELHRRVLERAAETVPPLLRRGAGGDVRIAITLEQDAGVPARAFADLGALVAAESFASLTGGHHAAD